MNFSFATELFDWQTGEQISSVNLNICVTSSSSNRECYTEKQDTQDSERLLDTQEIQIFQETQEKKEEIRALQQNENRKNISLNRGPHIPTLVELAQDLKKTEGLRRAYPQHPSTRVAGKG